MSAFESLNRDADVQGTQIGGLAVVETTLPDEPRLYYRTYGTGSSGRAPLICLPGFWRNSRDFEELADHLSASRLVVTPDMRGRGKSPRMSSTEDYHVDLLIQDVWRLLDHLNIQHAALLGTTLGGWMSLIMAADKPGRITGIVLNDVGAEPPQHASKRMAGNANADQLTFDEAVARTRTQNEAHFSGLSEDDWVRLMLRAHRRTEEGTYVRDFDQLTNVETARFKAAHPDFWTEYRRLADIPIAVLRGANSDYLSDDLMHRMGAEHARTFVATIPGRGHPPLLDEPVAIRAIEHLLSRADTRLSDL